MLLGGTYLFKGEEIFESLVLFHLLKKFKEN